METWKDLLEYVSNDFFILIKDIDNNAAINDKNCMKCLKELGRNYYSFKLKKEDIFFINGYILSKKDKQQFYYLSTHTFYNLKELKDTLKKYGFKKRKR